MNDISLSEARNCFFDNYDYYWLKHTMDRGIEEQTHCLLVGHSLARFGINDREIPGLINLSFLSQDYYYSSKIIKKALESIPTLQHIVIGTGYVSPFLDLSVAKNTNELGRIVRVYGRYFHDIHHMDASEYSEMAAHILPAESREREKEVFKLYEERKDNYFCRERDRQSLSDIVWADISDEERFRAAKCRTEYHNKLLFHRDIYEENCAVLQNIAESCHAKGVSLSMIVFPSNRFYRHYLDDRFKDGYIKQIARIPAQYRPLQWDLFASDEFDPVEDYIDTDHLNDSGASKMTARMKEYLENM